MLTYFKVASFWLLFFLLEILENTTSFVFSLSAPRISHNILKSTWILTFTNMKCIVFKTDGDCKCKCVLLSKTQP